MKTVFVWIACAFAAQSVALEARDARGLDVRIDPIAESVHVDGLAMHIQAASGRDVERLAARIAERWRAEGSLLQHHSQSSWTLLTRLVDGRSEVIQWRAGGGSAQLLHSVVDAMRAPGRPSHGPFVLPPQCAWGRVIEGNAGPAAYAQHTARCRAPPATLTAALRQRLAAQGWTVRDGGAMALQLARPGIQAQLIVAAGTARDESAVVWISTRRQSLEGR